MTLQRIADLLARGPAVVLSGAGMSTESGIPDYRGPSGALKRNHQPMTYQTFLRDSFGRRRYWARSHLGWEFIANVQPNRGHKAVAILEEKGAIAGVITQNVDGLHQAGGSRSVIDLHGRLDRVMCLGCGSLRSRHEVQQRLADANPTWRPAVTAVNPDGDADLTEEEVHAFREVTCEHCEGILKPDVVYFGENVPVDRVRQAYDFVDAASTLLILGSSLTVFSGRRFAMHAHKTGVPIVIINDGPTRADALADVKVEAQLGSTLSDLADHLIGHTGLVSQKLSQPSSHV
jgi:NAD-dependent SIR2 family protein deacetylase